MCVLLREKKKKKKKVKKKKERKEKQERVRRRRKKSRRRTMRRRRRKYKSCNKRFRSRIVIVFEDLYRVRNVPELRDAKVRVSKVIASYAEHNNIETNESGIAFQANSGRLRAKGGKGRAIVIGHRDFVSRVWGTSERGICHYVEMKFLCERQQEYFSISSPKIILR